MPDMDLIRTLGELAAHADLCAADPAAPTIDQIVARHRAAEYRRLQLRHLAVSPAPSVPAADGTVRFSIDGRDYEAPEVWVAGAKVVGIRLGMSPTQAIVAACMFWAEECEKGAPPS